MDQRGGAKPQTPVKRSRLDDVTFGADGRARDTHAQQARKRRQIAISDDDESKAAVKREYVRMLRAAREDIKERGQWDPIDEAIKAAQARVNLDDPRVDDMLRRIRGAMCLKVRTSKLASRVGTVWKSKFGRSTPSTQPDSLVDFHTGCCPAGYDARGRPSLPRCVPGGLCGADRRACCRRGPQ